MHQSAWRNCLENSLRHLERASVATRCTRMGTPSTLLGRSRTPIRDLSRISKQFRKGNSANFAITEFSEVRALHLCSRAHTLVSHRSMLRSLRGQLGPREGAGQLPAL